MATCTNGCCTDPEEAETRHGLSRREKLARDPGYGDWKYEQERDKAEELIVAHKVYADLTTGLIGMEDIPYHKFYKTEEDKEA